MHIYCTKYVLMSTSFSPGTITMHQMVAIVICFVFVIIVTITVFIYR